MNDLRRRLTEVSQADHARKTLLDDLFQKLDDMHKTMDRNAFIVVLIDGDCTLFLDELVKKGIAGGDEAAKLLRKAVFDYLRYDANFQHDHKIVIRIYANLRGLSHTYADKGILPNPTAFADFVLGFNKAHPLCDFIDAGNHKEAADSKLKENLNLYVYNVHCKQIIFGASADNAFASFLGSFLIDTEISHRIKLLRGLPFALEFANIVPKLQWTEFTNIFRSTPLADVLGLQNYGRRSLGYDQAREQESKLGNINGSSLPWRSKFAAGSSVPVAPVNEITVPVSWGTANGSESRNQLRRDGNSRDIDPQDESTFPLPSAFPNWALPSPPGATPSTGLIETALINSTNDRLKLSPKGLDFGVVKSDVEFKLGLTPDFWGKSEQDEWFLKSKNIIKRAVENWVERTGNPPPGNATWMRQHFATRQESPSLSLQNPPSPHRPLDGDKPMFDFRSHQLKAPEGVGQIFRNAKQQRVDLPEVWSVHPATINALRDRDPRLCNFHYLVNNCTKDPCDYDHVSRLSDDEYAALVYLSRSQVCPQGSACNSNFCIRGHMCPNGNGKNCKYGNHCKFAHLHGMDTTVVE